MKENSYIPVSKVARASKFVGTGLKVGANYLKYSILLLIYEDTIIEIIHLITPC
jgi:hypothetical protein